MWIYIFYFWNLNYNWQYKFIIWPAKSREKVKVADVVKSLPTCSRGKRPWSFVLWVARWDWWPISITSFQRDNPTDRNYSYG